MTRRSLSFLRLVLFVFVLGRTASAELKLITPAGFLPGRPFTVRVEVRTGGARDLELWNAEAILTVNQPGITLSTNRVFLRNGLGTVLLTVNGSSNFSLQANVGAETAIRAVRNRSGDPVTTVSGTLPGASSTWSGVVNVTGNVTVPAGHRLTINPDTFVIINGVASGTSGIAITVNGDVQSLGTEQLPVTITCNDPLMNWGQIRHAGTVASLYRHTLISKAGRVAGEGHTGMGPAIRMNNSSLTLESCVVSDLNSGASTIGKIMMATGSTLVFSDCVFARARMGPEIASTGLLCSNSYFMEMRGPDDADGIYLHDSGARELMLSGCVLAGGDDDAVDTLDSTVLIENCIIRDWANPNEDAKGVSAFNGEVTLRRCLIANCFVGASTKSNGPLGVLRIDSCTITGIEKGVSAATKSNATAGNLSIYISNSIVRSADALHSAFGPERFVSVTYCDLSEPWPGLGNITADPLFVNAAAGNFRLQPGSPCIDAADPAAPPDPDSTRRDIGFYTGNTRPVVAITAPADNTIFGTPANITMTAAAADPDGTVTNVTFSANGTNNIGTVSSSPFTLTWNSVPEGNYAIRAVARDNFGLASTSAAVNVAVSANTAGPRVLSQSPAPGTVTNLTHITVVFSKAVTGVDHRDFLLNGLPARSVTGSGDTYVFEITSAPPGLGAITWAPTHGITDTFTPANAFDATAVGSTWQYQLVDSQAPIVAVASPIPNTTLSTLSSISVAFSEPATGVNAGDLLINGVPATGVIGSGAGTYRFSFSSPLPGTVRVSWAVAHGISDQAGNPLVPASWNYTLDPAQNSVVINEIMYHPASENPFEEYIELFNRGATSVNLNGWRFSDGVQFTFPNVNIAPGEFLVVVANRAAFEAKYPGITNIVGNWTGTLSNSREDIDLDDASGNRVDSVRYADEGDWATRQRSLPDRGQRGWRWHAEHDGLGKSVELINPVLSNNGGQNWASSQLAEGTPGRGNSVFASRKAPFIEDVAHFPSLPKSTNTVIVTAAISGSASPNPLVSLNYRIDVTPGSTETNFTKVTMRDDGQGGDAFGGDAVFSATLPAQPNNTVVEFYIEASDALGNQRTWPAPAIPAPDGIGPAGQVANALYQVDDAEPGTQPLYKVIMRAAERAVLEAIGNNVGGSANSDAQMNATFISVDGTSTDLHYLASVRNRGHGSRAAKPNNFRVNFRSDEPWKGVLALNLNAQFSWLQVLGAALHTQSGSVGAYSRAVQFRVNNANLAFTGGTERTFGSYAANEVIDADWADRHFPNDSNGNVYRAIRDLFPPDFDYRVSTVYPGLPGPEDKNSYTNTWFKDTNVSEDNWSDLITMLRVLGPNSTEPFTIENMERVIDLPQWLLHLAIMNFIGNSETGLNTGHNDDYFMYRGVNDPRFKLVYYDLDQILGFNASFGPTSQLFSAANPNGAGQAIGRILRHPEIEPYYYEALRRLATSTFSAESFNGLVDQVLGEFVPEATRTQVKNFVEQRRNFILSQLPAVPPPAPPRAVLSAAPRSPTPRNSATFQVSGEGITHYRYSINGGALSAEATVQTPINLSNLPNGTNTLRVIGKNSAGAFQSTIVATTASWIVDTSLPAVRLNEIIASRSGNQPDQIELYNEGSTAINLAGFRLSDDPASPNRFTFGATVLNPGAYLLLDSTQLGFSLGTSGEGLYLRNSVAAGGALLDSVEFGAQITGLSIGRLGESGEWRLMQPTFGSGNVLHAMGNPTALKINEWHTAGLSPYPEDFVELYNPESLPVAIGGGYLTDQRVGAPTQSRIAPLTFVAARGHVVFTSGNGNSADEINFSLPSEQGQITLFDSNLSVIDSIVYGPQRLGISSGRCPDGSAVKKALQSPTPGAPNDCPFEPAQPQRIVLVPFSHEWKYNASGTDLGTAWKDRVYADGAWLSGPGALGFETDVLAEPLRTIFANSGATTYYFRTSFQVNSPINASSLEITHLIDDGAAFYLNGEEIGSRIGLPPGATAGTFSSVNVANATLQSFTIPADKLLSGTNVLAVEVHQAAFGGNDMVMGLQLSALVVTNPPGAAGVVINELLSDNASLPEANGSRTDWVELYNPSTATVDLVGMSLTDAAANPTRWVFPAGSLLPAKGFLRILCSSDLPASSTNTGFGLSADGGALFLYNAPAQGGALQNSITYGLQAADWSIGRAPDGSGTWVLNIPSPAMANRVASLGNPALLKVNEWMADPASGQDWFEIFNPNPEPVQLSGLWLSDDLNQRSKHVLPALSFIGNAARAFKRFEADEALTGANHVRFRLSAGGESLVISFPTGTLIDAVSFTQQSRGVSEGRLLDGSPNIVRFPSSASPGSANYLPLPNIVVNEVLTHTDLPLMDAVELYNPSSSAVTIGGWFLSDSPNNLRKYQIPEGVVIPAGGYAVFYEDDFNGDAAGEPFSFSSANGDEVYLSQAVNGVLTGYRAAAEFGAAENGVSFGRYPTSRGFDFVPLSRRTFGRDNASTSAEFKLGSGALNAAAKIGPIVISEIMYHPLGTNDALEFLELYNISAGPVTLQDPKFPANTWRLRKGVEFEFPSGTTIPAGGFLVVVSFNPATDNTARALFQQTYGNAAILVGPYRGRLSNSGDVIELQKLDTQDALDGSVPFVLVDRISYLDVAPWPTHADGFGSSLQKVNRGFFGNDPIHWIAAAPTPGPNVSNDNDADGMPNDWETLYGLNPNGPSDALQDKDGDGLKNLHEYIAGTNPTNAADALRLTLESAGADTVVSFSAFTGRGYKLLYSDESAAGPWHELVDFPAGGSALVRVTDPGPRQSRRFYQVQVLFSGQ